MQKPGIRGRFALPLGCESTSPTKLNDFLQAGVGDSTPSPPLFTRQPQDRGAVRGGVHAREQRDRPRGPHASRLAAGSFAAVSFGGSRDLERRPALRPARPQHFARSLANAFSVD